LPGELEFILLDNEEMTRVHGEFCGEATPTDVITFLHGEILICPEVAREQGPQWDRSLEEEVLLYGIHGMLHLIGFDDHEPQDYDAMARAQDEVLAKVLATEISS